ncbi:protein CHROMATIN REMODELING 20 [Sesamum angolense]|uniref:Protein CHROMATIN REMODELING 20 n=1 Tax=Sesamum angolense TaxID=2727404 RepID=A0AAE1X2N5_9LAMI|nr:protein CHROMATIN REMODELING 20 [Sesamum angolense]
MDAAEEREKDEEEIAHADNDCSDDSLEEEGGEDEVEEEVKLCSEKGRSSGTDTAVIGSPKEDFFVSSDLNHLTEPLTEEEIEVLIAELLEVESKAAEAQEALEEESLMRVETDVRKELALSLSDNELEKAVVEEMFTFKEEWEVELDELETDSAYLLEQLDSAGIELSSLYKWIERQVPSGCCTEAWKKRTHWVGIQMSLDATESVAQAEEYLQIHRPVTRRHGKIFETGASGFLGKKDAMCGSNLAIKEIVDADWDWFSRMCSEKPPSGDVTFGSNHWASVYLASTPQQAAELGLKFPGVNEFGAIPSVEKQFSEHVEEIDDVDGTSSDPFVADAIANERDLSLTEEQKRNFRKVKEEDDATDDLKLHIRMKPWRHRKRCKEDSLQGDPSSTDGLKASQPDFSMTCEDGIPEDDNGHRQLNNNVHELSNVSHKEKANVSNDNEAPVAGNGSSLHTEEVSKFEGDIASSSDSGSGDSDADSVNSSNMRGRKKKIRRILDDSELREETKKKIAIEQERQERLKSLEAQYSTKSAMMNSMANNGISLDGSGHEVLGDTSSGYIINLVREEGEDAIAGIRFMWENIIQSVRKVRSGDKGLGCILAHTMGLGLKTALVVMPVSVLHNWRLEFMKWRPSELKPLRIFMLEDVPRDKRVELLSKWRTKGGVFLIGYAAFRNLSLGKYVKDQNMAKEISHALQVGPDILVCDEAHIIKNTKADTTQALKQVKCQRRIALTGSPLQNNLMEWLILLEKDFLVAAMSLGIGKTLNFFQNPIENGQHTSSTVEDVKIMNQRSHILELYKRFLDVHGFTKDKASGEKIFKRSFLAGYQALAQTHIQLLDCIVEDMFSNSRYIGMKALEVQYDLIQPTKALSHMDIRCSVGLILHFEKTGNPHRKFGNAFIYMDWWRDFLQDNTYKEVNYSGKMVLLLDILTMCSNMGDKALVFSQSLLTLDLIEFIFQNCLIQQRMENVGRKGRTGTANRVIIVDGSWNPTYDLQAIFRVWRYGQTKPVFAYRLLAHGTMEEKIYKRQVTKEGLAARVVDRQQVHRTMSKEEILHLFEFGDDEKADVMHELGQEQEVVAKPNTGNLLKPELPHPHETSSDNLFEMLISRHHPSWISNYHEHDTLLQENEDEKLSKEEQDLAWELYLRTLKWEELKRVHPDETILDQPKISVDASASRQQHRLVATTAVNQKPVPPVSESDALARASHYHQNHFVQRKCTNLSHLLTLRSQGTKMGCSTICGECAQEIRWEDINRNGKLVK